MTQLPVYAHNPGTFRDLSPSLLMYGTKGAARDKKGKEGGWVGEEEKWSASRAVKVVSLANETNIRADRVDKR